METLSNKQASPSVVDAYLRRSGARMMRHENQEIDSKSDGSSDSSCFVINFVPSDCSSGVSGDEQQKQDSATSNHLNQYTNLFTPTNFISLFQNRAVTSNENEVGDDSTSCYLTEAEPELWAGEDNQKGLLGFMDDEDMEPPIEVCFWGDNHDNEERILYVAPLSAKTTSKYKSKTSIEPESLLRERIPTIQFQAPESPRIKSLYYEDYAENQQQFDKGADAAIALAPPGLQHNGDGYYTEEDGPVPKKAQLPISMVHVKTQGKMEDPSIGSEEEFMTKSPRSSSRDASDPSLHRKWFSSSLWRNTRRKTTQKRNGQMEKHLLDDTGAVPTLDLEPRDDEGYFDAYEFQVAPKGTEPDSSMGYTVTWLPANEDGDSVFERIFNDPYWENDGVGKKDNKIETNQKGDDHKNNEQKEVKGTTMVRDNPKNDNHYNGLDCFLRFKWKKSSASNSKSSSSTTKNSASFVPRTNSNSDKKIHKDYNTNTELGNFNNQKDDVDYDKLPWCDFSSVSSAGDILSLSNIDCNSSSSSNPCHFLNPFKKTKPLRAPNNEDVGTVKKTKPLRAPNNEDVGTVNEL